MAVATIVVAPAVIDRKEVEVVRAAAIAVGRSRPIVAEGAYIVERLIVAKAGGRKEDGVAVGAGNVVTVDAVERSPRPSTIVDEFLDFS